jgi:hypothetical protein
MAKILIIGPISDFGGREVEVNIFSNIFNLKEVKILSTNYMTANSMANSNCVPFYNVDDFIASHKKICFLNFILRALFFFKHDKRYFFSNKYFKKIIKVDRYRKRVIKSFVINSEVIVFFGQPTSKFLDFTTKVSKSYQKKIFLRTTGEITNLKPNFIPNYNYLNYVFHSQKNKDNINFKLNHSFIVDQTSLIEKDLLHINSKLIGNKIRYGFIGSLTISKGLDLLVDYLYKMNLLDRFYVCGEGSLLDLILANNKINYLGVIEPKKMSDFYKKIDVLIIPSLSESGPLVGIEALASAKLIVSTKVGAMVERSKNIEGVSFFDINSLESFKRSINYFEKLSIKSLNDLKKNNRTKYELEYSNSEISRKYKHILNEDRFKSREIQKRVN